MYVCMYGKMKGEQASVNWKTLRIETLHKQTNCAKQSGGFYCFTTIKVPAKTRSISLTPMEYP